MCVFRAYEDFDWLQQSFFSQENVPGLQGIIVSEFTIYMLWKVYFSLKALHLSKVFFLSTVSTFAVKSISVAVKHTDQSTQTTWCVLLALRTLTVQMYLDQIDERK